MNGYGQLIYPNGDMYEGMFKYDCKHGSGQFLYANQEKYVGEYQDDL